MLIIALYHSLNTIKTEKKKHENYIANKYIRD